MLVSNCFCKHCLGNSSTTDPNVEDGAHLDVSVESDIKMFKLTPQFAPSYAFSSLALVLLSG